VAAISSPVIEVHITNVHAREEFRHVSLLSEVCRGVICGLGLAGYDAAVRALVTAN
jgi:3-dehydroquinate dehydratase-2